MKKIKSVILKNYITYKNANLSLEEDGLYVIHGLNKDRPKAKSSNGSGKSLIVGVLPSLRFGSTPKPLKSKKEVKEGFQKNTEQVLTIENEHGNEYTIKKWFKGTTKLSIYKNGGDLKFRTKNGAELLLEKLLPLNEDQFYTLAYLDTKRPPMLQYGTDAQRHHFIESLYRLDIYDKLADFVKKDWQKTQVLVQEIDVLDRQLSIKSKDVIDDPESLEKKHIKLLKSVEEIRTKVTDYLNKLQECRTYIALTEGVDLSKSLDDIEQELSLCQEQLQKYKSRYSKGLENNKKNEAFTEIETTRKRLEKELEKFADVKVDKSIQDTIKQDTKLLDEIEQQEHINKKAKETIKDLTKELEGLSLSYKQKKQALAIGYDKIDKQLSKERVRVRERQKNLEETRNHLDGHSDAPCPICETLLDSKTLERILQDKETQLDKSRKSLKVLEQMVEFLNLTADLEIAKNSISNAIKDTVEQVAERIRINEEQIAFMRKKIMLKGQLKELPVLESIGTVDLNPILDSISKYEVKKEGLEKTKKSLKDLKKLNIHFDSLKHAKKTKNSIEEALAEYQPLLDKAQAQLTTITINKTRAESASSEIKSLSDQISELSLKTADHNIKTHLRKAFGPRGIRKQRVAEIGLAIQTAFNNNAAYVFDFPIKFELVITDTKFQILAERNNIWSDVRQLSGAESRAFTLLTLISLIQFCPPEQRLDTVILDEIEGNMDQPFRDMYINLFIPRLRKLIPKVVIVTPLSEKEMFIPKAFVYKAVKHNGISTLQKL